LIQPAAYPPPPTHYQSQDAWPFTPHSCHLLLLGRRGGHRRVASTGRPLDCATPRPGKMVPGVPTPRGPRRAGGDLRAPGLIAFRNCNGEDLGRNDRSVHGAAHAKGLKRIEDGQSNQKADN